MYKRHVLVSPFLFEAVVVIPDLPLSVRVGPAFTGPVIVSPTITAAAIARLTLTATLVVWTTMTATWIVSHSTTGVSHSYLTQATEHPVCISVGGVVTDPITVHGPCRGHIDRLLLLTDAC